MEKKQHDDPKAPEPNGRMPTANGTPAKRQASTPAAANDGSSKHKPPPKPKHETNSPPNSKKYNAKTAYRSPTTYQRGKTKA